MQEYFTKYDHDHDSHLSPVQFRQSFLDFNEPQIKNTQIDRILHLLLEEKKFVPMVSIERLVKLLSNYMGLET